MKFTVFQKGMVLVTIPLAFQLAFVLVVVAFQQEQIEAEQWASHTKEVIAQIHLIESALYEADAAVRASVLAGNSGLPEPNRDAARAVSERSSYLKELVQDNAGQGERAETLQKKAVAVLHWQESVENLVRRQAVDEALLRARADQGRTLMADFRASAGDFLAEEGRLDRDRAIMLRQSRHRLNVLFVVGGIVAIVSTLGLAYAFRKGIARRFAMLEANARRLAAGETQGPPLEGFDEIARIDRAFRDMAAALNETLERVQDLYDNAPCGYHSVGPDGVVVAMNRTELLWLGYTSEEMINRIRFGDVVSAASRGAYVTGFARVREYGAIADLELELVRKDGGTFPVLVHSTSVRDSAGRYLRSRTMLTDLSERKRAEAAAQLFAQVTQHITVGLLIYQFDGELLRVRSANPFASELLGVPLDQAIGRPVSEVFPSITPDQLRRYTEVACTGLGDDLGEFRYGDDRVAERWWQVQAFPVPGKSVGIAFQDVTDRKHAEALTRRLNAELEDRVRARTSELAEINRELEHRNAENEMFVYSVSHDLRSPLVNLQGFSKELEKACRGLAEIFADESVPADARDRGRTLLDNKVAKSVRFIQSAVLRLSAIIDALLRLSRAGRVEYHCESVDLVGVVACIVAAAQTTVAERNAEVLVGELPSPWGDRTAIEQVFANLIGNALTYLDPSRSGVIEIGCLPQDAKGVPAGFRAYFVRDNGLGIPEAHRTKIFQAFQRAHPAVGSGEGLGLAIVARVAERHRGQAWVTSEPGQGSTFFVTFPTSANR